MHPLWLLVDVSLSLYTKPPKPFPHYDWTVIHAIWLDSYRDVLIGHIRSSRKVILYRKSTIFSNNKIADFKIYKDCVMENKGERTAARFIVVD